MGTRKNWGNEMVMPGEKGAYEKYSKSEKRVYWGFVIAAVCGAALSLAWKPYIAPLLK
jgi:hypothetical protein